MNLSLKRIDDDDGWGVGRLIIFISKPWSYFFIFERRRKGDGVSVDSFFLTPSPAPFTK